MHARETGIALITALSILVVVALMVLGAFFTTQIELWNTRNDATFTQANYAAQAGLQKYKSSLFQYYRWLEDHHVPGASADRTACLNRLGQGIDWNRDPTDGVEAWSNNQITVAQEIVYEADGVTPIGTFDVTIFRDPGNNNLYSVQSIGRSGGARSTVRATFLITNTGILEQAIFTGSGSANSGVNGGATVRGAVYVVGDPSSSENIVLNSNGDFALLNEYDLSDSTYTDNQTGIRAQDYVSANNHTASNLCTTLRVEHGKVAIGGSSSLGTPDNKLLGVYVSDGGADDIITAGGFIETCTGQKGVCTDELSHFDVTNAPDFPTFDGAPNEDECGLSTWRDCIHEEAQSAGLAIIAGSGPAWPVGATYNGDLTELAACQAAFSTTDIVLDTQVFDCTYTGADGNTYGISYDGSTSPAHLEVYGSVNLQGFNLTLAQNTEFRARSYESPGNREVNNGSLVVEDNGSGLYGKLDIDANFIPDTTNTGTGNTQYPNHHLALIAEDDVYQRGHMVFAPIYSGGSYRVVRDNFLIGQVFAMEYCTTGAGTNNSCAAGQKSEVVHVRIRDHTKLMKEINTKAGDPNFRVLSYELR